MRQINSKSGMIRLCLMSCILLCYVFSSKNVFSTHWDKSLASVKYNQKTNSITCCFLFHQYSLVAIENGYIQKCKFYFSPDGVSYTELFSAFSTYQKDKDQVLILLRDKCMGKNIQCYTPHNPEFRIRFYYSEELKVVVSATNFNIGPNKVPCKIAYLNFKWELVESDKCVNYVKIEGVWCANNISNGNSIKEVYSLDRDKSNSKAMKNAPSVLKSEISNNVEVTRETDAISVSGAKPGDHINVYNIAGIVIKSVVANDDVVNIKLPTNQIYVVNVGQTSYKVAMCVP